MIKEKLLDLKTRGKVPVHNQYSESMYLNHRPKVKYKYLKCDYCGCEIELNKPKHERTGGIVKLSYIITKNGNVEIALCNKCVKPALAEFDK